MELTLAWKKLVLVGIAVAALAAYVTPFNELLGLNQASASSIAQNNENTQDLQDRLEQLKIRKTNNASFIMGIKWTDSDLIQQANHKTQTSPQ